MDLVVVFGCVGVVVVVVVGGGEVARVMVAWVVVADVDVVCTEIINTSTNIYDYQKKIS